VKFTYLVYSTTSNIHTQSVFIKYHSRQWFQLAGGSSSYYANFDVQNGVIGSVGDCTATIEDYGNGWYRCTATTTNTVAPTNYAIVIIDNGTATRLPNSTGIGSYYVWGAQLEQQSFATSYIPTSGSTATRLGETANNAGGAGVFNSEEGVLYIESALINVSQNGMRISISDGSSAENRITFRYLNNNQIQIELGLTNGFSEILNLNNSENFNKIAVVYNSINASVFINGVKLITDSMSSLNNLSQLQFNRFNSNIENFYGKVKDLKVFNYALTDEELQTLTT